MNHTNYSSICKNVTSIDIIQIWVKQHLDRTHHNSIRRSGNKVNNCVHYSRNWYLNKYKGQSLNNSKCNQTIRDIEHDISRQVARKLNV